EVFSQAAADGRPVDKGWPRSWKSLVREGQLLDVRSGRWDAEGRVSEIGAIKFSGDIRLRSESFFGLSNSLASGDNPAALGNDLSPRHRMRVRARLSMRGVIGDEFDWGLRLATGSFADNIATNQTFTDFFNRKPFALDQAFITYKPKAAPGLRLQGGKFEPPWISTELTLDSDLMVEGSNESYTRSFKRSPLKELAVVAWQLPFLERNSAFVRNADGSVNIQQSRRGGRDLALYGGQLRARFEPSSKVAFTLSLADLFYSGTQFISPVQVFGSQLQLPITITIPATATTPAQTVTTQVSIPRDLLVAGNGNLGVTNANNNATNRDGRLSSGFNLVDVIGRLDLKHSKRWPVAIIGNFVINTQTRGVVTAGPGGADLILPNHENKGFWGEVQVGATKARGDMLFGYTFLRIQKDAVLTPFNWSDITQQSDVRGHRFGFSYAVDPRVTFTATGIITERSHGLLGPFAVTPPGSSNRATTRLQFDTVIRF
ncbi:MAG: putative porin, partial [Acidobacteriota bacterium]